MNVKYDKKARKKAYKYSQKYAKCTSAHSGYTYYPGGDCANFVSQCLYAGGLPMTYEWYYDNDATFKASDAWVGARSHYMHFKKDIFCSEEIVIDNYSKVEKLTKKVQSGDLLYWQDRNSSGVGHATIIVSNKLTKGKRVLKYAGHTNEIKHKSVKKAMKENNNICHVLRIKNQFSMEVQFYKEQ